MKKFYVMAAAAAIAMSAAAQEKLYIVGDATVVSPVEVKLSWGTEGMAEVPVTGETIVLKVNDFVAFKMSTSPLTVVTSEDENGEPVSSTSWDEFNANARGCLYGFQVGVEKELILGSSDNIAAPWKGDYTVTIAGDLSTIKLETETPQPGGGYSIFLRGGMNDWGAAAEWQMECIDKDNLIYKFAFAEDQVITSGSTFKIADADWGSINFGMPQEETGEVNDEGQAITKDLDFFPMEAVKTLRYNGGDIKCSENFYGVAYFNLPTNELWISNDEDAANPFDGAAVKTIETENNGAAQFYNMQGVRVAEPTNGLYIVVKNGKAVKVVK